MLEKADGEGAGGNINENEVDINIEADGSNVRGRDRVIGRVAEPCFVYQLLINNSNRINEYCQLYNDSKEQFNLLCDLTNQFINLSPDEIRENLKEYNHGWRYLALPQWLINGLHQALLKLQDYHQYIPRQLHKDLPIVLI